jgi:hypothetical protein
LAGIDPFQVGVVVDVIEALDEVVVSVIDDGVQARPGFDKLPRKATTCSDLFLRE